MSITASLHAPKRRQAPPATSGQPEIVGASKRVVMETSMSSPGFVWRPGREYTLPEKTANRLIAQGDARDLTKLELAEGVKPEKAQKSAAA